MVLLRTFLGQWDKRTVPLSHDVRAEAEYPRGGQCQGRGNRSHRAGPTAQQSPKEQAEGPRRDERAQPGSATPAPPKHVMSPADAKQSVSDAGDQAHDRGVPPWNAREAATTRQPGAAKAFPLPTRSNASPSGICSAKAQKLYSSISSVMISDKGICSLSVGLTPWRGPKPRGSSARR